MAKEDARRKELDALYRLVKEETVAKPVRATKSYEGFFLLMKNIKVEAVKHYKHVIGDKAIDVEFK